MGRHGRPAAGGGERIRQLTSAYAAADGGRIGPPSKAKTERKETLI